MTSAKGKEPKEEADDLMNSIDLNGLIEGMKAVGVESEAAKNALEEYIKNHPLEMKRLAQKAHKELERQQALTLSAGYDEMLRNMSKQERDDFFLGKRFD